MKRYSFTSIPERAADGYVALCPEIDVASQGDSVEEALELFLETASPSEIRKRLHGEVFVTRFEMAHG